ERWWFVYEFEPDSVEYLTPTGLRLRGVLDPAALTVALTGLVARHESLRTTFAEVDGVGVQVVHAPGEVHLPVTDLSNLPEAERETELVRVVERESTTPFDLRTSPPLRVRLVRLADDGHVLTIVMHHIITDGWSVGVMVGELSALYGAAVRGEAVGLPPLPVEYADFAVWQRDRLSGAALDGQLGYWRGQLDGLIPLDLPTDRPRPAVRTPAGAVHEFVVPAGVTARLKELGRERDGTLFMTLVA